MQGLRSRSRTGIVLGLLGILPIETEIEKKKANLLRSTMLITKGLSGKKVISIVIIGIMLDKSIYGFVNDVTIALHKSSLYA